eukprot:gene1978-5058_t
MAASSMKVKVKWGKETFKDVEVNTGEDPDQFRAQLFSLTGVPPGGQKVMCKGMSLKDTWEGFPIKDKASILLMGTAGELPKEPDNIQFVEDLPESAVINHYPAGLANLGNTCYMNATVQCLKQAAQFKDIILKSEVLNSGNESLLVMYLQKLYTIMDNQEDRSGIQFAVLSFLTSLRQVNPQFAEQHEGRPAQQDANECWGLLTRTVDVILSSPAYPRGGPVAQYFGIDQRETLSCVEAPEEDVVASSASQLQLSCHIDKDIGFVLAGLKRAMEDEITKSSSTLGRDAVYKKQCQLSRLPAFLTINFVRFYFKRSAGENCKIRKDVKFPLTLDVYDLCSAELQEKLQPARRQFAAYQDWEAENQAAMAGKRSKDKSSETGRAADENQEKFYSTEFESDLGSNNSGYYELLAVLTHRGRSSNSGHYVAWVKSGPNLWYCMDDDKVSPKNDQDILNLSGSGGADWHTAYILLYGSKKCQVVPSSQEASHNESGDGGNSTAMDIITDN